MSSSRLLMSTLLVCGAALLTACASDSGDSAEMAMAGNMITGEGLPNPTSTVEQNWGDLPDGQEWGSTAGIDIDPNDGHILSLIHISEPTRPY